MMSFKNVTFLSILLIVLAFGTITEQKINLEVSNHDVTVIISETECFNIIVPELLRQHLKLVLNKDQSDLIRLIPETVEITPQVPPIQNILIVIYGEKPGHLDVTANIYPNDTVNVDNVFVRVTIAQSLLLISVSIVIGWMYFMAWSVSFYPQIISNCKRKSVVGLNFDFLSLNVIGFTLYGVFNCGLYFSVYIQEEYFRRYPRGLNPVLLNDVVFSLHAIVATLFTIFQCIIYERGDQRISKTAKGILSFFGVLVIVFATLAGTLQIHWLDFLYWCSYIKLTITLIKYIPQAVMNYRRKSTMGWSIGNVLLDLTGGSLSMLQMVINAHNYDDWESIFGDPTKFGLGLFSVLFDIIFILQHYILYRNAEPYNPVDGTDYEDDSRYADYN